MGFSPDCSHPAGHDFRAPSAPCPRENTPDFRVESSEQLLIKTMKRFAALILLAALAATIPAAAQRENRSIGENSQEAKRAAKQQQKYAKKQAKRQRKAAKKFQKAQRKSARQSRHK
jgi:hypothetical protein